MREKLNNRMHQMCRWGALFSIVLIVGCVAEPLPSPYTPDSTKILLSSLTEDSANNADENVALMGLPGAVSGFGTLRVVLADGTSEEFIQTTVAGSFVGSLVAKRGDTLRLSYLVDLEESDWIELIVPQYPSEKVEPPTTRMGGAPDQPSKDFSEAVDESNDPQDSGGDDPPETLQSLFEILPDGLVRIQTGPDFISPEDWLFVGNLVTGETVSTRADPMGAVSLTFAAEPGDRILMFSQSAVDPAQTSPVSEFEIPGT